jgi:hypothetical protein
VVVSNSAKSTRSNNPVAHRPYRVLALDRGFWNFNLFQQLRNAQSDFITRLKAKAQYESVSVLSQSPNRRDRLIRLGTGYQGNPILDLRLVEICHGNCWYRYFLLRLKSVHLVYSDSWLVTLFLLLSLSLLLRIGISVPWLTLENK